MVSFGTVYTALVVVFLLIALGLAVPVLKGIVVDGLERRRKWKTGEMERYTEDEEFDSVPPAADGDESDARRICSQCGAENDPAFAYCARCAAPL